MNPNSRIFIAGHRGMAGQAIMLRLIAGGYTNLFTAPRDECDLRDQRATRSLFDRVRPDYVVLAAATVGGILDNATRPAEFIGDNLAIQHNVIDASYFHGVKRLIFLGSSCVYPRGCQQPIKEDYLGTGPLEDTNRAYATAKLAGIEMLRAYKQQHGFESVTLMPSNLYGPGDNYHPTRSHVMAALIRKFVDAKRTGEKSVTVWGTGAPRREFLYVDDLAEAVVFLMGHPNPPPIVNVGTGEDVSIKDLAEFVARNAGFFGQIEYDPSKPDGTPQKTLDVSRMESLGWRAKVKGADGVPLAIVAYEQAVNATEAREMVEVRG